MKRIHKLKIDAGFLESKLIGDKLFEIRCNDRGFQKGDEVHYTEYQLDKVHVHKYQITYVIGFMQRDNYVVFGERFIGTDTTKYR